MNLYIVLGVTAIISSIIGELTLVYGLMKVKKYTTFEHVMLRLYGIFITFLLIGENLVFIISLPWPLKAEFVHSMYLFLNTHVSIVKYVIILGATSSIFLILRIYILADFNPGVIVGTSFISGIMATSIILSMAVMIDVSKMEFTIVYPSVLSVVLTIGSLLFLFLLGDAITVYKIIKYRRKHSKTYLRILNYEATAFGLLSLSMIILGAQRIIFYRDMTLPSNVFLFVLGLHLFVLGLGIIHYPFPYRLLAGGESLMLSVRLLNDQREVFRITQKNLLDHSGLWSTAIFGSSVFLSITMKSDPLQFHAKTKNAHLVTMKYKEYIGSLYLLNRGAVITRYALKALLKELYKEKELTENRIKELVQLYLGFLFVEDIRTSENYITMYFLHL